MRGLFPPLRHSLFEPFGVGDGVELCGKPREKRHGLGFEVERAIDLSLPDRFHNPFGDREEHDSLGCGHPDGEYRRARVGGCVQEFEHDGARLKAGRSHLRKSLTQSPRHYTIARFVASPMLTANHHSFRAEYAVICPVAQSNTALITVKSPLTN